MMTPDNKDFMQTLLPIVAVVKDIPNTAASDAIAAKEAAQAYAEYVAQHAYSISVSNTTLQITEPVPAE